MRDRGATLREESGANHTDILSASKAPCVTVAWVGEAEGRDARGALAKSLDDQLALGIDDIASVRVTPGGPVDDISTVHREDNLDTTMLMVPDTDQVTFSPAPEDKAASSLPEERE